MTERYRVQHQPDRYACNMGFAVVDTETGHIVYRGPQWAATYRANTWNRGDWAALGSPAFPGDPDYRTDDQ